MTNLSLYNSQNLAYTGSAWNNPYGLIQNAGKRKSIRLKKTKKSRKTKKTRKTKTTKKTKKTKKTRKTRKMRKSRKH